jgi:hypothetical protein
VHLLHAVNPRRTLSAPNAQELQLERAARERLSSAAAGHDASAAEASARIEARSTERNGLLTVVESLRAQLTTQGAELAVQLEQAARLVGEHAAAEARAREADRAKTRLQLDASQLRQVRRSLLCGVCDGRLQLYVSLSLAACWGGWVSVAALSHNQNSERAEL